MTEPSPYAAFVDESGSDRVRDPGTYILSAAVIAPEVFDHIRLVMRDLALKGQKKLHWRDESTRRHALIARAIAELPLEHLVVVRDNAANDRDERRRRTCLQRMAYELDQLGIGSVTLESRGRADDRRDLDARTPCVAPWSRTASGSRRIGS